MIDLYFSTPFGCSYRQAIVFITFSTSEQPTDSIDIEWESVHFAWPLRDFCPRGFFLPPGEHGMLLATLRNPAAGRYARRTQSKHREATICKPWKSLAAVTFCLLLSVPGLTQAQFRFTTIDVPSEMGTEVNGNSPHAIAGQYGFQPNGNPLHGFVLKNGSFTTIDVPIALDPGVFATQVDGINAPGQLVGTYFVGSTNHGFFENNGNFIKLDPANIRSQGGGINAKGQVSGTYRTPVVLPDGSDQKRHGFIWSNGTFTTFNVPGDHPVFGTVAFGINDIGGWEIMWMRASAFGTASYGAATASTIRRSTCPARC